MYVKYKLEFSDKTLKKNEVLGVVLIVENCGGIEMVVKSKKFLKQNCHF